MTRSAARLITEKLQPLVPATENNPSETKTDISVPKPINFIPPKRGRGRPRKNVAPQLPPEAFQTNIPVDAQNHQVEASVSVNPSQNATIQPTEPLQVEAEKRKAEETSPFSLSSGNIAPIDTHQPPVVAEPEKQQTEFIESNSQQNVPRLPSTGHCQPPAVVKQETYHPQYFSSSNQAQEVVMMPSADYYQPPVVVKKENTLPHVTVKTENIHPYDTSAKMGNMFAHDVKVKPENMLPREMIKTEKMLPYEKNRIENMQPYGNNRMGMLSYELTKPGNMPPYGMIKTENMLSQISNQTQSMLPHVKVKTESVLPRVSVKTENQLQNDAYFSNSVHGNMPMLPLHPRRHVGNAVKAGINPFHPRVAVKAEFRDPVDPSAYLPHNQQNAYNGSNGYWNPEMSHQAPVDRPTSATVHHRPDAARALYEQNWHRQNAQRYHNPAIYQELNAMTQPTSKSVDAVSKRLLSYRQQYMAEQQARVQYQEQPAVPWMPRRAGSYQYSPALWGNAEPVRRRTRKPRNSLPAGTDPMEWLRNHLQAPYNPGSGNG